MKPCGIFFVKNMSKHIRKCVSKDFSVKYSPKFLNCVQTSTTDELKTTSKWAIQNIVEDTTNAIRNRITKKLQRIDQIMI